VSEHAMRNASFPVSQSKQTWVEKAFRTKLYYVLGVLRIDSNYYHWRLPKVCVTREFVLRKRDSHTVFSVQPRKWTFSLLIQSTLSIFNTMQCSLVKLR